jgi:hypothetical protein
MDTAYSSPTPKTPTKQTTRDIRLRIQTLYWEAKWSTDDSRSALVISNNGCQRVTSAQRLYSIRLD